MKYDFDAYLDRRNTGSLKCDFCELEYGLKGIIPMWVADMDLPAPQPVVEAIKKRAEHPAYGYTLNPASYWESIIRWMKARHGWDVRREWLSKSPGVVPALNICVQAFTHPGDKVVIQTPVYHPFFSAIENNGRRVVRNPLKVENGRYLMDTEDLEKRIDARTRMLILCSPHNPVGRVWTKEEIERLGRICVRKDLMVISDEIHGDLVFNGHKHVPAASVSPELAERTITCVAPSKTFNVAGLSTSVIIASNPKLLGLFDTQAEKAGLTFGNTFGIVALEAAYTHGAEWLDQLLPYLEANMDLAAAFFETRVPKIRFLKPEGTYLALLDCRDLGMDQEALDDFFLRKAGVLFDEGTIFGKELRGFERMNLACPRPVLKQALERIEKAVNAL
jgi:cystathionine beta-lyase